MKEMWDERYQKIALVYGAEPNEFLKESLQALVPGKILFPGEGEGRNAVFAAQKGWRVDACDFSAVARQKALERANENKVKINYFVADVAEVLFEPNTYDVIALIYLHLSPAHRNLVHQKLVAGLKPGGVLLLETFSKDQLKYGTGGPKNPDLLYELTEIETDFRQLNIKQLEQTEVVLNEGDFHRGLTNVIRLIGIKPPAGTSNCNATGGYLAPDTDISTL